MRVLVVGYGSIGKRHTGNLFRLGVENIVMYRTSSVRVREYPSIKVYRQLEEALSTRPDIVLITNPTHLHVPIALQAAQAAGHSVVEGLLTKGI